MGLMLHLDIQVTQEVMLLHQVIPVIVESPDIQVIVEAEFRVIVVILVQEYLAILVIPETQHSNQVIQVIVERADIPVLTVIQVIQELADILVIPEVEYRVIQHILEYQVTRPIAVSLDIPLIQVIQVRE